MTLDEDQKKAVEYLDNALVIAGAGAGKTTTIIAKINYLIENNIYQEDEILIISFTNETVNNLKARVKYNVDIKTFHKLAISIINDNNLKLAPEDYLEYTVNEYFNSYAFSNKKIKRSVKRLNINSNQYQLQNLIKTFINLYKANYANIKYLHELFERSFFINRDYLKLILDIYQIYLRELESSGMLDFNDLITHATYLVENNERKTKYKFIIIDEFQDSSLIRFKLILSIIKQNKAKLFAVGDDYQSIYRFSGCDLDIFLKINEHIPNIKRLFINHNYRNPQNLINVANRFILKNKRQIKKNTICHKDINKPIVIYFYTNRKEIINKVINNIKGNILVLGRNNRDQERFNIVSNDRVRFLTIHRAKGLEEDNIILVNLDDSLLGFPSKIKNEALINKVLKSDYFMYEEERRLMYVALTRTKNKIYLLVPKNNYSIFIKELIWHYKEFIDIKKEI